MAPCWSRLLVAGGMLAANAAPLAGQTFGEAEHLLARGDTNAAITMYEAMVRRNLKNAEAHYLAGVLYMTRHIPGSRLSPNRRKAEEHFRYATRFESDSVKYWLALADLFRGEDNSFTRLQVPRLISRAREAAHRSGATSDIVALEYQAARMEWERYEHFGRRYLFNDFSIRNISTYLFFAEWQYVEQFFRDRARYDENSGEEYLIKTERHLRRLLTVDTGNVAATGLLVVLMGEQQRWPETLPVTRRLVRAVPDSGRAWALYGLALIRERHWQEAETAFDRALALMSEQEAEPYRDLGQIMRTADRVRFDRLPRDLRATLDTTYWNAAQPLALTELNELRAEFYGRVTYVLHRWTDPLVGYRGHETDIGAVYIRYGPPDIWAVFNRSLIAWVYELPRFRFLFSLTPGFALARFTGSSREALREGSEQSPARFDNVPVFRTLDTILVQTAQFRSLEERSTMVAVFGAIPLARMLDSAAIDDLTLTTAAILSNDAGREINRSRREAIVRAGSETPIKIDTWRLSLPPQEYLLRVEAHIPVLGRGARSAAMLGVRGFWGSDLMLSDVLAADRAAPRDSVFARWTDFYIEPSAGRFEPGDPVALLWEIYNLRPDSTGMARYTVELRITVSDIERHGVFARIMGGIADAIGLSALGDDEVSLSYDRVVQTDGSDVQVEYLTIDLRDAAAGTYTITITVTDAVSGRTVARERTVVLSSEPLVRDLELPRGPTTSR